MAVHSVLRALWFLAAALQVVAAVATMRGADVAAGLPARARGLLASGFALAAVLLAVGAVADRTAPLIAGSAVAVVTPMDVGLASGRLRPAHLAVRCGVLLVLLSVTVWTT